MNLPETKYDKRQMKFNILDPDDYDKHIRDLKCCVCGEAGGHCGCEWEDVGKDGVI